MTYVKIGLKQFVFVVKILRWKLFYKTHGDMSPSPKAKENLISVKNGESNNKAAIADWCGGGVTTVIWFVCSAMFSGLVVGAVATRNSGHRHLSKPNGHRPHRAGTKQPNYKGKSERFIRSKLKSFHEI